LREGVLFSGDKRMSKGVAVIGGGIAGVQAALDLAEQGIKVYIIEKTPSLGGRMAQLDKTFPTNDCSMCILSPKLVEAGRHPNIELLTLSEIKELEGEEGEFKIKVLKSARYVDEVSCTGCGICAATCPVKYEYQIPEKVSVCGQIPADDLAKIDTILKRYADEEGVLISVLQDINEEFNYLPENVLRYISERLDIPLSQIYHVATFYTAFSLIPRGEHIIKVCQGTACHVRGSERVLDELGRILDIGPGETTQDLKFTLETVNCLGACALGPVVVIDDKYHSTTPANVGKLLKKVQKPKRRKPDDEA
jgi:NADH:ubiquinone oxidoreductase subunit E